MSRRGEYSPDHRQGVEGDARVGKTCTFQGEAGEAHRASATAGPYAPPRDYRSTSTRSGPRLMVVPTAAAMPRNMPLNTKLCSGDTAYQ